MNQPPLLRLLIPLVICLLATPASADELAKSDGYSVRVPLGFHAAEQQRSAGGARIRSRFGSMPLDGSPHVQAYISGQPKRPAATLLVARLDLKEPIRTQQELGLRQLQSLEATVPDGFDFQPREVDGYEAIEMEFATEIEGDAYTTRVVTIACGHYLVVMMLESSDEQFRSAETTWADLIATVKIVPRRERLITLGIVGLIGMFAIWVLLRLTRSGSGRSGVRRGAHESSLILEGSHGSLPSSTPSGHRGSEIRRPQPRAAPARQGLRNTLPDKR